MAATASAVKEAYDLAKSKDKINAKRNEEIGNKVIEIIEKNENKVHEKLTVAFNVFQTEYAKPLRRKLPITGMKMNWSLNQIALK